VVDGDRDVVGIVSERDIVRIIAEQWTWTFQLAGADGKLDTPDDIITTDSLHVEVNKTYRFLLQSRDVVHSFFVPVFRLKQDAVPGRVITGWFRPTITGVHDITCAQICGIGHGVMGAHVVIEDAQTHQAWIAAHTPTAATGAGAGTSGAVGAAVTP